MSEAAPQTAVEEEESFTGHRNGSCYSTQGRHFTMEKRPRINLAMNKANRNYRYGQPGCGLQSLGQILGTMRSRVRIAA